MDLTTFIPKRMSAQSILPKIAVEQRPEGLLVGDTAVTHNATLIFMTVFAIFWNVVVWSIVLTFGVVILVVTAVAWPELRALVSPTGANPSFGGVAATVAPFAWVALPILLFCGVGIWIGMWAIRQIRIRTRFWAGELFVSTWPLRLGQDATVHFRRRWRGRVDVTGIEAVLACAEVVSYGSGTNVTTVTERVYEQPLSAPPVLPHTQQVEGMWRIQIPRTEAPSFAADSNNLVWSIDVTLHARRFPDVPSSFPLLVPPEVL